MQVGALYLEPGDLFISVLVIGCFIAVYFIIKANKAAYEDGYNEGYEKGYQDAILDGLEDADHQSRKAAQVSCLGL